MDIIQTKRATDYTDQTDEGNGKSEKSFSPFWNANLRLSSLIWISQMSVNQRSKIFVAFAASLCGL